MCIDTKNISQAEEEGAMEEDEVEEMDVVEEEMVEAEEEDHPVQLVDEEAVEVPMRQTFHQVSLVILYSICIGKRKTKARLFHTSY